MGALLKVLKTAGKFLVEYGPGLFSAFRERRAEKRLAKEEQARRVAEGDSLGLK